VSPKSLCLMIGLALSVFAGNLALAHPPSQIAASFDPETSLLTIRILHSVPDPRGDHYIDEVRVFLNGKEVIRQYFFSQLSAQEQQAQYLIVDAKKGDVLEVFAHCSKFGDRKVQPTVE